MNWSHKNVVVTGGAGFIGSNLVDALLERGAQVTIVDMLQLARGSLSWNRKLTRLEGIFHKRGMNEVPLEICDLETDKQRFQLLAAKADVVFHLSALFGGREFVDTRQVDCSKMLSVDHNVIDACYLAGVERLHYASSACVYPNSLQTDPKYLLKEDDILSTGDGWKSSDNLYGFAKLMGELQCNYYTT
jgi:UDP-glucose 4-epimerase